MKVELICIGTELLLGETENTNATYLAKRLSEEGMNVYHSCVVDDHPKRLAEALQLACSRSDLVVTTGGLGPTKDDLTKEVVARLMGSELVFDQKAYDNIIKRLIVRTEDPIIAENNRKQAYVPKGAEVYYNEYGTAPGFRLASGSNMVAVLPGPPREMKAMFEQYVVPYIRSVSHDDSVCSMVKTHGLKESTVAMLLADLMNQENPSVATYAKPYGTDIRILASSDTLEHAQSMHDAVKTKVVNALGKAIYSCENETLQEVAANHLIQQQIHVCIYDGATRGTLLALLGMTKIEAYLDAYQIVYDDQQTMNDANRLHIYLSTPKHDEDGKISVIFTYKGIVENTKTYCVYQDGEGFYQRICYTLLDDLRKMSFFE